MMIRSILTAASLLATTAVAVPANAAVTFSFAPGVGSPSGVGFIVVDQFNNASGLTGSGFLIRTGANNNTGARPANSTIPGTPYLAVQTGGSATFTFAAPVSAFQFDWGSIDTFNTLTVTGIFSGPAPAPIIPGSNFPNLANGNQVAPATNGLFTLIATGGDVFTSVTFSSSGRAFEVDNLATLAIPEPATWAMLIAGFGMIGFGLRSRRKGARVTYA